MTNTQPKKVVIVGGGFGGITVAKALKKANVEVLLIDKTNHHLFQPLLYQVATAALAPEDISMPIREVLRNQANATVILADVDSIDPVRKTVHTKEGIHYSYDILIIATGGMHSYFGQDQWAPFAPGLKTLADALLIRQNILLAFEHAERCDNAEEAKKYLRFVIIGGGPTGVELAGAIAEISTQTMFKNFRKIKPEQAEIFLVEGVNQILPSYPASLAKKAKRTLEKMGVHVLTNAKVTDIQPESVQIGDKVIESGNIIWAAGNKASSLVKSLGVQLDRHGRVLVEQDLRVPGYPDVFVIGDAAHLKDKKGNPLPGIAPVAIQQGRYVAKLIRKNPKKIRPFSYFDKGQMATIGRAKAILMMRKLKMSGFWAWVAWSFIHIAYLINFRSKVMVMTEWCFWYFTGHRNARLIIPALDEKDARLKITRKGAILAE